MSTINNFNIIRPVRILAKLKNLTTAAVHGASFAGFVSELQNHKEETPSWRLNGGLSRYAAKHDLSQEIWQSTPRCAYHNAGLLFMKLFQATSCKTWARENFRLKPSTISNPAPKPLETNKKLKIVPIILEGRKRE